MPETTSTGRPLAWIEPLGVAADFGGPSNPFEPIDEAWLQRPLLERFDHVVAAHPDKQAVHDGVVSLSFPQLKRGADDLAARLHEAAPAGRPIVVVMPGLAEYTVACLAVLAVGRPLVLVDAGDPFERQASILREVQPGAVVSAARRPIGSDLPLADAIRFEVELDALGSRARPDVPLDPDAVGAISFTSGSTGRPKGVAFAQREVLGIVAHYVNANHLCAADRILGLATMAGSGGRDALAMALTGAGLRLFDLKASGLGEGLKVMGQEAVTVLSFVPSAMRAILQVPGAERAFHALRILDLHGEHTLASDIALMRQKLPPGCHIHLTMGSTEALSIFRWFVRDEAIDGAVTPVGYLFGGKEIALVDEAGAPARPGEFGEMIVRSRHMALGGWQGGRLAPGPFQTDPDDPSRRIYPVGDLVRIRPDGLAEVAGRRDRQVKVSGLRADLDDVEKALRASGAVADAAVVAFARRQENARLVAFVVAADPDAPPVAAELRREVAAATAPHMSPARIHLLDALPRLPNHKPDLTGLIALAEALDAAG